MYALPSYALHRQGITTTAQTSGSEPPVIASISDVSPEVPFGYPRSPRLSFIVITTEAQQTCLWSAKLLRSQRATKSHHSP